MRARTNKSGQEIRRETIQAIVEAGERAGLRRPAREADGKFSPGDRVKVVSGQYAGDEGKIVEEHGKWWLVAIDDVGDRKLEGSEIELAEARRTRAAKTMPVTFWINSADLEEDEAGKFKAWLKKEKGDAADDQKSKADWKALHTEFGKAGEEEEEEEAEEAKRRAARRRRSAREAKTMPVTFWINSADLDEDEAAAFKKWLKDKKDEQKSKADWKALHTEFGKAGEEEEEEAEEAKRRAARRRRDRAGRRPVREQPGSDLARELQGAADHLDSAAAVVDTVIGKAKTQQTRSYLGRGKQAVDLAYRQISATVLDLASGSWESARPIRAGRQAREQVGLIFAEQFSQPAEPRLKPPDVETLMRWNAEGGCEAACPHGCWVEPDGTCPHGNPSWLLKLGYI